MSRRRDADMCEMRRSLNRHWPLEPSGVKDVTTYEVDTDRGDVTFRVSIVRKSQQKARLPNPRVSNKQELEKIIAVRYRHGSNQWVSPARVSKPGWQVEERRIQKLTILHSSLKDKPGLEIFKRLDACRRASVVMMG